MSNHDRMLKRSTNYLCICILSLSFALLSGKQPLLASEFIDGKKIIQEKPFLADQELKDFIQDKILVSFGSSQLKSNLNNLSVIYRKIDIDGNMKVAMGLFPPLFGHDSSNEALGSFIGKWGVEGDKVIFAEKVLQIWERHFHFALNA